MFRNFDYDKIWLKVLIYANNSSYAICSGSRRLHQIQSALTCTNGNYNIGGAII